MRSNYTNSDCFDNLKCRLHCEFDKEKNIRGVLYKGHIKSPLFTYFAISSLLEIFKKKKSGYFVTGIYLKRVILPNRSIAFFQGSF